MLRFALNYYNILFVLVFGLGVAIYGAIYKTYALRRAVSLEVYTLTRRVLVQHKK